MGLRPEVHAEGNGSMDHIVTLAAIREGFDRFRPRRAWAAPRSPATKRAVAFAALLGLVSLATRAQPLYRHDPAALGAGPDKDDAAGLASKSGISGTMFRGSELYRQVDSLYQPGTTLTQPSGPLYQPGTTLARPGGPLYQPGAKLYQPGQSLAVTETAKELHVTIPADILFDFDKATIRPEAASALHQLAVILRERQHGDVRIEGHTDSLGRRSYNLRLSERRAIAVETWLMENEGFSSPMFRTVGYGASRPVAPNTKPDGSDDPAGRQRNRRVELVITK